MSVFLVLACRPKILGHLLGQNLLVENLENTRIPNSLENDIDIAGRATKMFPNISNHLYVHTVLPL